MLARTIVAHRVVGATVTVEMVIAERVTAERAIAAAMIEVPTMGDAAAVQVDRALVVQGIQAVAQVRGLDRAVVDRVGRGRTRTKDRSQARIKGPVLVLEGRVISAAQEAGPVDRVQIRTTVLRTRLRYTSICTMTLAVARPRRCGG